MFYDSANRLRPKYAWWRDGIGRLPQLASGVTVRGDSLVAALSTTNAPDDRRDASIE